jgi:DNA-binding protein HU-beta
MNQSELIEKVAQATELDQAAAGQAVKAVVNAILDALSAGEEVRVAGFGVFDVAARPARQGRNPRTGETIAIAASKAVRFHAGKSVKDALNPPRRGVPGGRLHHHSVQPDVVHDVHHDPSDSRHPALRARTAAQRSNPMHELGRRTLPAVAAQGTTGASDRHRPQRGHERGQES